MSPNAERLSQLLAAYALQLSAPEALRPYKGQAPCTFTSADTPLLLEHMSQQLKRGSPPLGSPALREALKSVGIPYRPSAIREFLGLGASRPQPKVRQPGAHHSHSTELTQ